MTLRTKTLGIVSITLVALIVAFLFSSAMIVQNGFAQVEQLDTRKNVQRALDAYTDEIAKLNTSAGDWANWDDTYAFIEDGNATYRQANLTDDAMAGLNLNLFVYIHASGRVVFSAGYDVQAAQGTRMPESFQAHLAPNDLLLQHPDIHVGQTGLVLLPEGPLLLASRPILTSERTGPSRGTMIMGRYLDTALIEQLGQRTHVALSIQPIDAPQLSADFAAARALLLAGEPSIVQPLNDDTVAGYTLVRDIYGQPALLVQVTLPREIYAQGRASTQYQVWWLLIVGLVFGGVTLLSLEHLVLARLGRLGTEVRRIGTSRDLASRVSQVGRDELAYLAVGINGMLGALEHAQVEQQRIEIELYQAKEVAEAANVELAHAALNARDQLSTMMRMLASPVIPVLEGILVMPLVGDIDSVRAAQVMETALHAVEQWHAQTLILDVTGVPLIDTRVAQTLLHITQAVHLLGAQTILVGLRPELAQTIIGLGLNLSALVTYANLQEGIRAAMRHQTAAGLRSKVIPALP